ncbi:hypothetical protein DIPPA_21672 [Diplonema papillatum]|nr:hypothetical protein DIPPA_21672 [Diplonema papillatum]
MGGMKIEPATVAVPKTFFGRLAYMFPSGGMAAPQLGALAALFAMCHIGLSGGRSRETRTGPDTAPFFWFCPYAAPNRTPVWYSWTEGEGIGNRIQFYKYLFVPSCFYHWLE